MSQSVVLRRLHRPSCRWRNCLRCKRLSSFWNAKNKLHHVCCFCVGIFALLKGSTLLQLLLLLMWLSSFCNINYKAKLHTSVADEKGQLWRMEKSFRPLQSMISNTWKILDRKLHFKCVSDRFDLCHYPKAFWRDVPWEWFLDYSELVSLRKKYHRRWR